MTCQHSFPHQKLLHLSEIINFNSLTHEMCGSNFENVIFKLITLIVILKSKICSQWSKMANWWPTITKVNHDLIHWSKRIYIYIYIYLVHLFGVNFTSKLVTDFFTYVRCLSLAGGLAFSPDVASRIIVACAVLHNICHGRLISSEWLHTWSWVGTKTPSWCCTGPLSVPS